MPLHNILLCMGLFMSIKPIRVQFKTACELLDISRESLHRTVRTDANFPLSAVIQHLRIVGHNIVTRTELNLNGKGTHVQYELKEARA